jgi:hypothetical protein
VGPHDGVRELRELLGHGRENGSVGYEPSFLGDGDVRADGSAPRVLGVRPVKKQNTTSI